MSREYTAITSMSDKPIGQYSRQSEHQSAKAESMHAAIVRQAEELAAKKIAAASLTGLTRTIREKELDLESWGLCDAARAVDSMLAHYKSNTPATTEERVRSIIGK